MNIIIKGDPEAKAVVQKYGGWKRVLDPTFEPPQELYDGLKAVGYDADVLDRMRAQDGKPEREAWLDEMAFCFYTWWLQEYRSSGGEVLGMQFKGYPGIHPNVRWHEYPNDALSTIYAEVMAKHKISRDDIDAAINGNPDKYIPLDQRAQRMQGPD